MSVPDMIHPFATMSMNDIGNIAMGPFEKRDVAKIMFDGASFDLDWDIENNRSLLHHVDKYAFTFPGNMKIRQILEWFFINSTIHDNPNLDMIVSDAPLSLFNISRRKN